MLTKPPCSVTLHDRSQWRGNVNKQDFCCEQQFYWKALYNNKSLLTGTVGQTIREYILGNCPFDDSKQAWTLAQGKILWGKLYLATLWAIADVFYKVCLS